MIVVQNDSEKNPEDRALVWVYVGAGTKILLSESGPMNCSGRRHSHPLVGVLVIIDVDYPNHV